MPRTNVRSLCVLIPGYKMVAFTSLELYDQLYGSYWAPGTKGSFCEVENTAQRKHRYFITLNLNLVPPNKEENDILEKRK